MLDKKRLGWLLKQARENQSFSIYDVDRITKKVFKASQLSAYENGRSSIPLQRLDDLARIYGQTYYTILTRLETNRDIRDITDLSDSDKKIIDLMIKSAREKQPKEEKLKRTGEQGKTA